MNAKQLGNLRSLLFLSGVVLLVMVGVSIYVWTRIPAGTQVCIHWNAVGACDGYGSKFVGIFLMPLVVAGVVGLLTFIPRIDPRAAHIEQSRTAYAVVWATLLLFFLALHTILMLDLLGLTVDIGIYVPLLVGVMFVVIGSFLGSVRSNYFFGIRTPWTLSSELSWRKTHQLGGKLFVLLGLLFILGALVWSGPTWVYLLVGGSLVMGATVLVYSYIIWRRDPERESR